MKLRNTALLTLSILGSLSLPAFAESKLTILPFEVLSIRPEVKNLGKNVSGNLIEALNNVPAFLMTEQNISENVMNDLGLKASNLSDDKNALKIGKYLESELVLPGTIEFENNKYKINLKLIDVKTGKSLKQIQLVSQDLNDLQNKLVTAITEQKKIKLNNLQKEKITKYLKATKSIKAIDYYYQGLDSLQKYTGQSYEQAMGLFDKALLEDRNYFPAKSAKTKARAFWAYEQSQLEINNYKNLVSETEENINSFLKESTGNADIYKSLSLVDYIHKDFEKGKKDAKKALDLNPHDTEAFVLSWLNNGSKIDDKNLGKAIKQNTFLALPHIEMGKAYQKLVKTDNATTEFQEALKSSPDNVMANYNLGQIFLKTGRLDDAINKFVQVLKFEPETWQAHSGIGIAYRYQDKLSDAVNAYKNSLRFNADNSTLHQELGVIYTEQGELNDSVTEYKEAIRLSPDNAKSHYYLGTVYKLQENIEPAIAEYKESIKLEPNFAEAHYNLGIAYKKINKVEDAIAEYKTAIKISPKFAEAHLNLGGVYLDQNKFNEAIAEYKEAIKIRPNYPRAYNNLGSAYQKQGKLDLAINEYKQAIKLDSKYGSAYYNLSQVYKEQKKTKEALDELKKACQEGYKPACL